MMLCHLPPTSHSKAARIHLESSKLIMFISLCSILLLFLTTKCSASAVICFFDVLETISKVLNPYKILKSERLFKISEHLIAVKAEETYHMNSKNA